MRIQTVINILNKGTATCEACKSWTTCIELIADSHSYGTYCLPCAHKHAFTVERVVSNPYTKKERRRTQKIAKKSEAKTAKETGSRSTGYIPNYGDSRNGKFLFEDKTKVRGDRKTYRLSQDVILKGRSQALLSGLTPIFRVHLKDVSIAIMLWDDIVDLVKEEENDS